MAGGTLSRHGSLGCDAFLSSAPMSNTHLLLSKMLLYWPLGMQCLSVARNFEVVSLFGSCKCIASVGLALSTSNIVLNMEDQAIGKVCYWKFNCIHIPL